VLLNAFVIRQLIDYYLKRRKKKMDEQHRVLIEALGRRHDNEAAELRRRYAALGRLERREFASFDQKFGEASRADDHRRIDIDNVVITYKSTYDLAGQWTSSSLVAYPVLCLRNAKVLSLNSLTFSYMGA